MYLKSLTLKGFKSFADRTHMVFDPGLTVVVGPNGSGKSNVSDAILWVLGEQSAKMLRGSAMEDVIFSGSSARQAVGIAEVTLVLDNSDHTLPVDFNEVAIMRRMYRSGESEYLINGSPARLMDIQDILHDSGLGKDTHSIISQGKLDSVLSGRPEQRRELIEEAAGISKHRRRKERSERKLKSMNDNLVRAKDIQRMIIKQLKPLERQVDKAKRAGDIKERLALATTTLAVDDLRQLQIQWNYLAERKREAEAQLELDEYRLQEKKRETEKLQHMLEQKGLFVGDLGEQRRRMQDMLGRIESDMRLLEEKGKNMVERLSEMRRTLSTLEHQRQDALLELHQCDSDLVEAEAALGVLTSRVESLSPESEQARKLVQDLQKSFNELVSEQRTQQKIEDSETLAYARLTEQISNAELEVSMFKNRLVAIDETIALCEESTKRETAKKEEAQTRLGAAKQNSLELQSQLDDAKRAVTEALAQEQNLMHKLSEAKASLSALASVDQSQLNANPLVATLTKNDSVKQLVKGHISDYIEVEAGYDELVEDLLGDALQALVVSDRSDLLSVFKVTAQQKNNSGSATVIGQGIKLKQMPGKVPSGARLASDLISAQDNLEPLVKSLLCDICLVDTFEQALDLHQTNPDFTFVSADGAQVKPDGRCIFGKDTAKDRGALERKRCIRALEKEIPTLEKSHVAAQNQVSQAQDAQAKLQERYSVVCGEIARLEGELTSISSELGRLDVRLSQTKAEKESVLKKQELVIEKAKSAQVELDSHKQAATAAKEKLAELKDKIEDVTAERDQASQREKDLERKLSEARLELATVSERNRHQAQRKYELSCRVEEFDQRRESLEKSSRALEVLRLRVGPLHERYDAIQKAAFERAALLRDRASLAEADSDSLKKTIGDARREVGRAHGKVDETRSLLNELKVSEGKLEVQVETAIQGIVADGAYTLEDALELQAPENREALQAEVDSLRAQLESIGPVNEVAWEEYSKLKERSDYVCAQVEDLEQARRALAKITAAIDRKMRRQFMLTFERVNQNFQEIFGILFPGGKAHLEMLDPDHPDQTGIEIVAQPKGKRITKMMLMSGGEKSLTALALLFAVYKTRTVPFYVFDEVEAALDASNLDKLLYAIEELKKSTQLIVISHQRRTMEQADVLYGVSMQADGVSHVVSQRLDYMTGKVVDL